MPTLNQVNAPDEYDGQTCIISNVFGSKGGFFSVSNNSAFLQAQYSKEQGFEDWTEELEVGVGAFVSFGPDLIGLQFRNATPGKVAVITMRFAEGEEPVLSVSALGTIGVGVLSINVQHNTAVVGTENTLNFTDTADIIWQLADVVGNSITVEANSGSVYNIMSPAYGASPSSSDNGAAINAAAAAANAAGGGTVYVPPGNFQTKQQINWFSNVRWCGVGYGVSVIQEAPGANLNALGFGSNLTNIGSDDLTWDGNGANQTGGNGNVLSLPGATGVRIKRVAIKNPFNGASSRALFSSTTFTDAWISECLIDGGTTGKNGIDLTGCSNVHITKNTVRNSTLHNIVITNSFDFQIDENICNTATGHNIFVVGGSAVLTCARFSIDGNVCDNAVDDSINVSQNCSQFSIDGNIVNNAGTGITGGVGIEVFNNCSHFTIGDNDVNENGGPDGIQVAWNGSGGSGCSSFSITGNECYGASNTHGIGAGIQISGGFNVTAGFVQVCSIVGNTCTLNHVGISVQETGGSGTDYLTIQANTLPSSGALANGSGLANASTGAHNNVGNNQTT